MTLRLVYLAFCALVIAGLVHVAVVLLIPAYGTKDAYATLSKDYELLKFRQLTGDNSSGLLSDIDPFFAYGTCHFDFSEEGVSIIAPKFDTFWSATVINQDGSVVYILNSRTAIDSKLELIMLNPVQILRLREVQPPEIENSIVVETDMKAGFVVLRVLQPDDSWAGAASTFLEKVKCAPYTPAIAEGAALPQAVIQ